MCCNLHQTQSRVYTLTLYIPQLNMHLTNYAVNKDQENFDATDAIDSVLHDVMVHRHKSHIMHRAASERSGG